MNDKANKTDENLSSLDYIEIDTNIQEETFEMPLAPVENKRSSRPVVHTPGQLINCLKNEKVIVRFINRKFTLTNNPKHVYSGGMAENAVRSFTVPMNMSQTLVNPLNADEQRYLEHILGLNTGDLSSHKKDDNYWENYTVSLRKEDNHFDLSDPNDYIKVAVLKLNDDYIAKNLSELSESPKATHQFVIIAEQDVQEKEDFEMSMATKAYRLFGQIENNIDKMKYIISVMEGKPISDNVDKKWLTSQTHAQLKRDPKMFVNFLEDKLVDTKILISKAVKAKLITKIGTLYYKDDKAPMTDSSIDPTLEVAAQYLASPKRQALKFSLEAKLKDN